MHMNNNNQWYWNLNLHRHHLSLANSAAIDSTTLPSSSAFYTSAVLTDVGICVNMRNVHLNSVNQHRKIPNCYNNLNLVSEKNKETRKYACHLNNLPIVDTSAAIYNNKCIPIAHNYPCTNKNLFGNDMLSSYRLYQLTAPENIMPFISIENNFYGIHHQKPSYLINAPINGEQTMSVENDRIHKKHDYGLTNGEILLSSSPLHKYYPSTNLLLLSSFASLPQMAPDSMTMQSELCDRYHNYFQLKSNAATPKKKYTRNYMLSNVLVFVYKC